jgi:hypothetical protein
MGESPPAGDSRLVWLAETLAQELADADPADAAVQAASPALQSIAAFTAQAQTVQRAEGVGSWQVAMPIEEAPFRLMPEQLAPLLSLSSLPLVALPRPQVPTGLALGQFTDEGMAQIMWGEIAGLESAALTGLHGYVARAGDGVVLMAGPVDTEADAADRCGALSLWGLSCVPAAWPSGATALAAHGSHP